MPGMMGLESAASDPCNGQSDPKTSQVKGLRLGGWFGLGQGLRQEPNRKPIDGTQGEFFCRQRNLSPNSKPPV